MEYRVIHGIDGWYYLAGEQLVGPFLDKEEAIWYAEQVA
jgi:hypothetical protein